MSSSPFGKDQGGSEPVQASSPSLENPSKKDDDGKVFGIKSDMLATIGKGILALILAAVVHEKFDGGDQRALAMQEHLKQLDATIVADQAAIKTLEGKQVKLTNYVSAVQQCQVFHTTCTAKPQANKSVCADNFSGCIADATTKLNQ